MNPVVFDVYLNNLAIFTDILVSLGPFLERLRNDEVFSGVYVRPSLTTSP